MPEETTPETPETETEVEESPYIEEEPVYNLEPEEPEPEVEAPEFQAQHYEIGAKFGLTPDQVDGFGSTELFEGALGRLEAIARVAAQGQNTQPAGTEPGPDDTISEFSFSDPAEYDPEVVELSEQTNRRFAALEKRVEELTNENQFLQQGSVQRNAEQNVVAFEQAVNGLDEETFGRGSFDNVGSQHSNNRMKLAQAVSRLGHGYSARGEEVPPIEKLVEEALPGTFPGEIGNQALKTAASESRRQRGQAVAAPTRDLPSEKTSTEAAIQAAADWFRENDKR